MVKVSSASFFGKFRCHFNRRVVPIPFWDKWRVNSILFSWGGVLARMIAFLALNLDELKSSKFYLKIMEEKILDQFLGLTADERLAKGEEFKNQGNQHFRGIFSSITCLKLVYLSTNLVFFLKSQKT
jgi:hypothetical protein